MNPISRRNPLVHVLGDVRRLFRDSDTSFLWIQIEFQRLKRSSYSKQVSKTYVHDGTRPRGAWRILFRIFLRGYASCVRLLLRCIVANAWRTLFDTHRRTQRMGGLLFSHIFYTFKSIMYRLIIKSSLNSWSQFNMYQVFPATMPWGYQARQVAQASNLPWLFR